MNYDPSASRNRAAAGLTRMTQGLFVAGMLFVASPAISQGNPDPGDQNEGCGQGAGGVETEDPNDVGQDFDSRADCRNTQGIPVPLAAAGIPALLVLGGGFIAVRKRRRDSQIKK